VGLGLVGVLRVGGVLGLLFVSFVLGVRRGKRGKDRGCFGVR